MDVQAQVFPTLVAIHNCILKRDPVKITDILPPPDDSIDLVEDHSQLVTECLCLALLLVAKKGDDEQGGTTGEDSGMGSLGPWWLSPVENCGKAEGSTTDGFEEAADQVCPRWFTAL